MEYFPLFLKSPCVWHLVWCCVQSSSTNTPHSSSYAVLERPPPRGCSCSVPSSPLPSPGPGVCAPNPSLATVSLCLSSPAFGAAVGFQPCLLWLCGVSLNTRLCFPFLPHLGACYFSGGSTAPLTLSLAAQRKSELCSVVEEHGMCPCYRRIRMQCLL